MPYGSFGIRRIIDQQLRFRGPGSAAWLRVKNFTDPSNVTDHGFIYTPPASGNQQAGYTDYPIQPPPVVQQVSMHNLGMAAAAGVNLREGARNIMITQTWVEAQKQIRNLKSDRQVFEAPEVIGIVTADLLVSIEYAYPDHAYGHLVNWYLLGNASELKESERPDTQ